MLTTGSFLGNFEKSKSLSLCMYKGPCNQDNLRGDIEPELAVSDSTLVVELNTFGKIFNFATLNPI